MTRLTEILLKQVSSRNQNKNTKKMTNYVKSHYNTRVATTQYLRESILDRKAKISSGGMCLGDMQVLLDCLKLNEFQENTCIEEMLRHRECVKKEKALQAEMNALRTSDDLGSEGRLNNKQANKLLRMFPNPAPQFYFTHKNKNKLKRPVVIQYKPEDPPYIPIDIYRKRAK